MYECFRCKKTFEEPNQREEVVVHDELPERRREYLYIYVCPYCKSESIDEVYL